MRHGAMRCCHPGPATAVLVLSSIVCVHPQAAAAQTGDPATSAAVLAVVQRFFDTMVAADERGAAEVLVADGQFYSVRQGPDGTTLRRESHGEYLASVATGERRLRERLWDPTVMVHDRLAVVWTPYDFHLNDRFSHCGVDAFNLVRTAAGWKIASVTYTVQTVGCGAYSGISAALPTGSYTIAADGLVAAFDMVTRTDDGRLRDFSGNGHHGRLERTDETDGWRGRARRFTRVTDRVSLTAAPGLALDGPLSIAAWVRVDRLGLHQHLFACDDKWALWITPDDQFRLGDTQGGGWSAPRDSVPAEQWVSVVAVLRGSKGDALSEQSAALYLDGELVAGNAHLRSTAAQTSGAWNPAELHTADACYIGFESHQGNEAHQSMAFHGAIDELLLFSRALTRDEVEAFADR